MVEGQRTASRWPRVVDLAVAIVVTALVLRQCFEPGYILVRDLVFVPDPAWRPDLIAHATGLPRGVPSGLWEAVTSHALGAPAAERLTLALILLASALGTARAARDVVPVGSVLLGAAAATAAVLNAFVAERLLIGQWVVLVGYAALGWCYVAGRRLGRDGPAWSGWAPLTLAVLAASIGGPQAWVLTTVVVLVVAYGRWSRVLVALAICAVAGLPWALPSVIRPHGALLSSSHSELFAIRSDSPLGVLVSVLTGGGIWNADAVPDDRGTVLTTVLALGVLAVAALGATTLVTECNPHLPALGALAAVGIVVPMLSTLSVFADVIDSVPGGGLLRDAHRFVGLWVFVVAILLAAGVDRLWRHHTWWGGALTAVVLAALVGSSASLAAGQAIGPTARHFPDDYATVRQLLDGAHEDGAHEDGATDDDAVLLLPWAGYRKPDWNDDVPFTEPFPRMVDRRVIADGSLTVAVAGTPVTAADDDPLARAVGRLLDRDLNRQQRTDALAELGIGWVLVDAGDAPDELDAVQARVIHRGEWLTLARLEPSGDVSAFAGPLPPRWVCWTGVTLWLAAWLAALAGIGRTRLRRATSRNRRSSAST